MRKLNKYKLLECLAKAEYSLIIFDDELNAYDCTQEWESLAESDEQDTAEMAGIDEVSAIVVAADYDSRYGAVMASCIASQDEMLEMVLEDERGRVVTILARYNEDLERVEELVREVSEKAWMS